MPGNLRTCIVSYQDGDFKHSVEVVAETLFEATVLGIRAMNAPRDQLHLLNFDVTVKAPEVHHSITGAQLSAWLTRNGKTPKEQALKVRLGEMMRG